MQADIATAVAEFLANKGVTRCPTACATRTTAKPSETDRQVLAAYHAAKEQARLARLSRPQAA